MTRIGKALLLLLMVTLTLPAVPARAMGEEQRKEFERIGRLGMADLTREALALLEEKYPEEDWEAYDFPDYVYTNESVEVGYMIAVKEPEVLTINTCYCFCDAMGHESLLNCFLKKKKGLFGGRFDDHAADCNICYGQAMMAFLWKNLGATDDEIRAGMEKKFERLIKKHEGR